MCYLLETLPCVRRATMRQRKQHFKRGDVTEDNADCNPESVAEPDDMEGEVIELVRGGIFQLLLLRGRTGPQDLSRCH